MAEEREKFNIASTKLAEDFERERGLFATKLEPLQSRLSSVTQEIAKKNSELSELQHRYQNAEVTTLLGQMSDARRLSPQNEALIRLIEIIRKDRTRAGVVESHLQGVLNPLVKANLMFVLYEGTADKEWFSKLREFSRSNRQVERLWSIFGLGSWAKEDEIEVIRLIINTIPRLSEPLSDALIIFRGSQNTPDEIRKALSISEREALMQIGRKLAMDEKAYGLVRIYGVRAAAIVAPEAYPVFLGLIYDRPGEREDTRNKIRDELLDVRSDSRSEWFRNALDRLKFPRERDSAISAWLKTKEVRKWVDLLTADHFQSLMRY